MKDKPEDTPPSSVHEDEIEMDEDDELIYIGDADDVLGEELMEGLEDSYDDRDSPIDSSIIKFTSHQNSVFCCNLHPNGKIAVTGGEDDKAYVWKTNGQEIMECKGHKDSVIFAEFCYDGSYLATADMSGAIQVWKCVLEETSDEWPKVWDYETGDLLWGTWHNATRVLICGSVDGEIYVFKIPSGETKVLQGHRAKVECAKLFPDGVRLAAGYDNGHIRVWDLKSQSVIHHIQAEAHPSGITSLDTYTDNNLIASVSSNGQILLSTATTGKITGQLEAPGELETVAFTKQADLGYFAVGSLDGELSIWDVAKQMVRHQCMKKDSNDSTGVTKLFWEKNYLFVACLDGTARIYEGRSGNCLKILTGHKHELLDMCYSAKENVLLTTSADGTARIFDCKEFIQ